VTSEVFVDTGAWIAVSDKRDQYHIRAAGEYRRLIQGSQQLVVTNMIVAETYTAIRRAMGHAPATRFLQSLNQSKHLRHVFSDAYLERQAQDMLVRYADQDFSYVDAVSFALMRQRGITEAFAFDHHFVIAGFRTLPT